MTKSILTQPFIDIAQIRKDIAIKAAADFMRNVLRRGTDVDAAHVDAVNNAENTQDVSALVEMLDGAIAFCTELKCDLTGVVQQSLTTETDATRTASARSHLSKTQVRKIMDDAKRRENEYLYDWTVRLGDLCEGLSSKQLSDILHEVSVESYIAGSDAMVKAGRAVRC